MDANIKEIVAMAVAGLTVGGSGGYFGTSAVESGERDALQQTIDLLKGQATEQKSAHSIQMDSAGRLCTDHVQRAADRLSDATAAHERVLDIAVKASQANSDRCTAEKAWFQNALKAAAAAGPIGGVQTQ